MKLKLFKKYFLITMGIVALSFVILMMILSIVLNNSISDAAYQTLDLCGEQISEKFANSSTTNADEFGDVLVSVSKVAQSDIFLTDPEGTIVACACDEWQKNGKCMHSDYILPKKIIDKSLKKDDFEINTLGIYKYPHYVSVKSLGESSEFFVFATMPISQPRNLLLKISKVYYVWAVIPIVLMFAAIYILTYRITKPIKSMSETAKAVAKGDFSKRVPVTTDDEIGELAVSFNMMINSLSRQESTHRSFVGDVSHELRTPMTTIGGFIDGILDGTIKEDERDYYLGIVSQEIKRLSRLVNGMLNMAKLESGEFVLRPVKFDFYELLCTVMISQEQRIEKNNLIISGLDTMERVTVCADKDLIYQVVYNLVDNAIKFTDEGGEISFELSETASDMIFTITNTGVGIKQKELPFVFERFYKGDKSRSNVKNSTGLGLYIVKTIISAHKGKISVKSKENEFTAFKVILPKEN